MRRRWSILLIAFALVLSVGVGFALKGRKRPPKVEYNPLANQQATSLQINYASPSTDLDSIPETPLSVEPLPGEVLELQGSLTAVTKTDLRPVVIEIIQVRSDGDVVADSAVAVPTDARNFAIRIKAPVKPGEYSLRAEWGGGHNYIARARLRVRPTPE